MDKTNEESTNLRTTKSQKKNTFFLNELKRQEMGVQEHHMVENLYIKIMSSYTSNSKKSYHKDSFYLRKGFYIKSISSCNSSDKNTTRIAQLKNSE